MFEQEGMGRARGADYAVTLQDSCILSPVTLQHVRIGKDRKYRKEKLFRIYIYVCVCWALA